MHTCGGECPCINGEEGPHIHCGRLIESGISNLKWWQATMKDVAHDPELRELWRQAITHEKTWIKRLERWHLAACKDQGTR